MNEANFTKIDAYENHLLNLKLQLWESESQQKFSGKFVDGAEQQALAADDRQERYVLTLSRAYIEELKSLADRQVIALQNNINFYADRLNNLLEKTHDS